MSPESAFQGLSEAAEALFCSYGNIDTDRHRAAQAAFAHGKCPYYDEPRARWLVAKYEIARSVLRDPRLGNDLNRAALQTNSEHLNLRLKPDAPSLLFIDPPLHDVIKAELARLFTRDALQARSDFLRRRWKEALKTLSESEQVWLGAFVHPILLTEVYEILGLGAPADDEVWAVVDDLYAVNLLFDLNTSEPVRAQARAASDRMRCRIANQLAGCPVAERMRAGGADKEIILSTVVFMLRAAVVTLGSMAMSILTQVLTSPLPATNANVHELLVGHTPTGDTGRVALDSLDLAGVSIHPGQTVIVMVGAANIDLADGGGSPTGHLVFGAGTHRCVGERMVRYQVGLAHDAAADLGVRVEVVAEKPHRTPSFRGLRDVCVRVCRAAYDRCGQEP